MGPSIPLVCQDWANTKATYRFFSNDRVSEAEILAGHFQSTRDRATAAEGFVLVLHDTTSDQSDLAFFHPELAGLLDDDAQPFHPRRTANSRVDYD